MTAIALKAAIAAVIITLSFPAAAQTGNRAADVGGASGRIIGAALVCGVERARLQSTGASALRAIDKLGISKADRDHALSLYMAASAAGADEQRASRPRQSCAQVRDAFNDIERQLRNY